MGGDHITVAVAVRGKGGPLAAPAATTVNLTIPVGYMSAGRLGDLLLQLLDAAQAQQPPALSAGTDDPDKDADGVPLHAPDDDPSDRDRQLLAHLHRVREAVQLDNWAVAVDDLLPAVMVLAGLTHDDLQAYKEALGDGPGY